MDNKEIAIFSVIVMILGSFICFISYKLDEPNVSMLTVFTPSLVALVLTAKTKGRKGVFELFIQQTVKKTALKWPLVSLFGIPVIASLAMLTSLDFDVSRFHLRTSELFPQAVVIVLIAIGEEYGWRGFLLPRLMNKSGAFKAGIILGLIWGLWHFPAYLIGTGVPLNMNFLVFLLWVVLGSLFISWIYFYTKSVLLSILVHMGANAAFNYLVILPEFTGNMSTFRLFILYLSVLIAIIYYHRRKDLVSL